LFDLAHPTGFDIESLIVYFAWVGYGVLAPRRACEPVLRIWSVLILPMDNSGFVSLVSLCRKRPDNTAIKNRR